MINPRLLLQLEGAAVFFIGIVAYGWNHGGWGLFVLLFLLPDGSMIGYFANARIGALLYNAVHTHIGPLLLGAYAIATDHRAALLFALIWVAHIGLDRALGAGLKYPSEFKAAKVGGSDKKPHAIARVNIDAS